MCNDDTVDSQRHRIVMWSNMCYVYVGLDNTALAGYICLMLLRIDL